MFYYLIEFGILAALYAILGLAAYVICRAKGCRGLGAHVFCVALFTFFLSCIFSITGMPSIGHIRWGDANINLIPFINIGDGRFQYIANIILFLPVGFFVPLLWNKMARFYQVALLGLGLSLTIEFLQLFTFRAVDVDDLLMNTLGGILGYLLYRLAQKILPGFLGIFRAPDCCCFHSNWGWLTCITTVLLLNLLVIPPLNGFFFQILPL